MKHEYYEDDTTGETMSEPKVILTGIKLSNEGDILLPGNLHREKHFVNYDNFIAWMRKALEHIDAGGSFLK